jgi:N6-adenosine-specific RNA methylase IME4
MGQILAFPSFPGKLSATGWLMPKKLPFERWVECGAFLQKAEGAVQWWLGDWWVYGEHEYGERVAALAEGGPLEGMNFQTLMTYGWVARSVTTSSRLEVLSFRHHQDVASLEPADQRRWLAQAAEGEWSCARLRAAIRDWKRCISRERLTLTAADGLASVVYADPPWSYSNSGFVGSADSHYETMSVDDICALNVKGTTTDEAVLFIWVTSPLLAEAFRVVDAWGFSYKTGFVWLKDKALYGKLGFYLYSKHEHLLLATRGSFLPELAQDALPSSVIEAPVNGHSRKPERVYEIIESMYPSSIPRMRELFLRGEARQGWMRGFGNEARS